MTRPNFFILGVAKSGTTSLYDTLGQHPDVFFSTPKEPIFFEAEYEKGLDYYARTYFADFQGESAVGEARHRNLYLPYVAPRIQECFPDARLIVILRNPVDRAYSDWLMRRASGADTLPFEEAVEEDLRRIESGQRFDGDAGEAAWKAHILPVHEGKRAALTTPGVAMPELRYRTYVDSGYYAEQIDRYLGLFPSSRLEIVFLDDFSRDPQAVCRHLWTFLGVEPNHELERVDASNVRGKLLTTRARRLARKTLGEPLLARMPRSLRRTLGALIDKSAAANPKMNAATRELLVAHYAPHNRRLEEITGRDLSHWSE